PRSQYPHLGLRCVHESLLMLGICENQCQGNEDCGARQQCIRRGCRRICAPSQGPGVGPCAEECQGDQDCGVGRLCVSNGCGHVCWPALDREMVWVLERLFCFADGSRPGSCPRLPPGTIGPCVELCSGDESCPVGQKCCSHGCGHSCQTAVQD
ncbi:hypothetical protein HPG69_003131, partial [Diceros bicornis minor]